ncbi:hypothetical protein [Humibacillus xanthopallidus]|uniref:hypothetical protein n=1 Tax=Humibacillus xanthopallidus TaxID=412689 RepID=UPI00384EECE8
MTTQTTPDQNPTQNPDRTRAKVLDLSITQLLGGAAAAATAAALGSRLGVVGTIAGAAVLSLISAVAASLYTASMTRARDAVVLVRTRRGDLEEVPLSTVEPQVTTTDAPTAQPTWWGRPDRLTARRLLVTSGAVFAIAAAFLAGLQLATGAQVTGTSIGVSMAAASGVDSPQDDSGAAGSSPTSTSSGTPSVPAAGDPVGPGSTDGAPQTGAASGDGSPATGSPGSTGATGAASATAGASQGTTPGSPPTAPGATSGNAAGGIPTGAATSAPSATTP